MQFKREMMSVIEIVPSTIDLLLEDVTTQKEMTKESVFDLRVILEEAITNAVKHGNEYDTGKTVSISVGLVDSICEITVQDEGEGFDVAQVPDPVVNEELKSSGRGIYLMRKLAQKVEFNEKGTCIKIIKKIELV